MLGITHVTGKVQLRLLCLIVCYSLLLSSLPSAWRGGRGRSQTATPQQGGQRLTGAPSANLPNLDMVRNRKEPEPKAAAQTPAKRCRWFDLKCKQAKEKKAENHLSPDRRGFGANGARLIASADRFDLLDWRGNTLADRLLSLSFGSFLPSASTLLPDLPVGIRGNHLTSSSAATAAALQSINFNDIMTARADAKYRTGTSGEDLFSGNYNWSLPIMSFPGRAGHDLSLTLSYNSTMWVRTGNTMVFDPDFSPISPGFRLGLPMISHDYLNTQNNKNCYQLILPSGRIVELRQISTGTYESGDSTYTRLTIDPSGFYILKTTDGTQLKYQNLAECIEIKDRNGNQITIEYSGEGLIFRLTDTLGRMIDFNYDEFNALQSIGFKGGELIAQFSYVDKTLNTNFRDQITNNPLSQYNFSDGLTYPALSEVYLEGDGSTYTFEHSTYGQVYQIRNFPAGLERSKVVYNLPVTAAGSPAQSDCPRFTQRTDTAYEWNTTGVNTLFQITAQGSDICGQVTSVDGTVYKEIAWGTGWQRGLVKETQTLTGATLQKKTETIWDQDVYSTYQNNPRATETKVIDVANGNKTRRTVIGYTSYNLPTDVYEYDYNQTTLLRRSHTDDNFSSTYTSRRIIGLLSAQMLYDGGDTLMAKMTYSYDEGSVQFLWPAVINHDTQNYGDNFIAGRGNPTSVRRYDVNDANGTTFVESQTGYYLTGRPQFTRDPLGHQTNFLYNDHFSDGLAYVPNGSLRTFAYPTQIQDPDGHVWSMAYNFDWGTATETTDPKGAKTRNDYSKSGRLNKTTNEINGAYIRYDYDPQQYFVKSYSTIQEGQGEFYSITVFDGHGRPRATISDHPGSSGQYKGVYNAYDNLGRQSQQSNPTEVNGFWIPAGDDAVNGSQGGWRYSLQTYDWQGRPLVTTNQDETIRTVSYAGCGCAGGQETTITDEGTVVTNPGTGQPETKKRQQKIFHDVFGRVVKTQLLNWENGSVYSTTINSYDVRDQIANVKEYSGNATGEEACPSATCQITTREYDGHGRLWKQRRPVETADNVYLYNADDTLWKATDPRNVTATYGYNNRKLVTGIGYDAMPNAALPSPLPSRPIPSAGVTFGYDSAGNRTWINDAPGRVDYTYDTLSRMTEETRLFDVGGVSRSFTLKYGYNLAGQLKQITDPWNAVVNYNRDKAGQETSVTATGYKDLNSWTNRDVNNFAINLKHRAWGGIKQFSNGSLSGNTGFAMEYDARLRLTSFTGGNRTTNHTYYNDGLIKEVSDQHYGSNFLRKYEYDQVSQLTKAHAGGTAQTSSSPYSLTYGYNVWGHTTSRTGSHWSTALANFSTTYTNDRDVNMLFDAAGNVKSYSTSNDPYIHYNAASQLFTQIESGTGSGLITVRENYHDSEGAKVFYQTFDGSLVNGSYTPFSNYYLVRSSVLNGKVIAEFQDFTNTPSSDPLKYNSMSYVYLKGVQLGYQKYAHRTDFKYFVWTYHNPTVGNYLAEYQLNNSSYQQVNFPAGEMTFDPLGSYVGLSEPQPIDVQSPFTFSMGQFIESYSGKCYADYVEAPCTIVQSALRNGWGAYAPWDNTRTGANNRLERFTVDWDNRFYGFVPVGARRSQDGRGWYDPYSRTEGMLRSGFGAGFGLTGGQKSQTPTPQQNCATPNSLINDPEHRKLFESLWDRTMVSGEENGTAILYEAATNIYHKIRLSEGKHLPVLSDDKKRVVYSDPAMPKALDETNNAIEKLEKEGRKLFFMAIFHTHPNYEATGTSRDGTPSGWGGDLGFQRAFRYPLGIIRTGNGYSFFMKDSNFGPDDPKANRCIWELVKEQRESY